MQLGVRWRAGEPPHRSVPSAMHRAILEQEAAHPEAHSWTLTWLEGRPRCALDDAALLALDATGHAILVAQSNDHAAGARGDGDADSHAGLHADDHADDHAVEDDDWLN